jgi:hypothetical protein
MSDSQQLDVSPMIELAYSAAQLRREISLVVDAMDRRVIFRQPVTPEELGVWIRRLVAAEERTAQIDGELMDFMFKVYDKLAEQERLGSKSAGTTN